MSIKRKKQQKFFVAVSYEKPVKGEKFTCQVFQKNGRTFECRPKVLLALRFGFGVYTMVDGEGNIYALQVIEK